MKMTLRPAGAPEMSLFNSSNADIQSLSTGHFMSPYLTSEALNAASWDFLSPPRSPVCENVKESLNISRTRYVLPILLRPYMAINCGSDF